MMIALAIRNESPPSSYFYSNLIISTLVIFLGSCVPVSSTSTFW